MSKSIVKITFLLVPAVLAALALVVVSAGAFSQNANSSTMSEQNANSSMAGTQDTTDTGGGVNEDLTGNYTGTVTMSGGHEMSGDATLSISGNTFTLESGGMTHNGRIYAINTRRYIGAALYFNDLTDPVSQTPLAASVRVIRRGRTFLMTPVPGARNRLRFTGRSTS